MIDFSKKDVLSFGCYGTLIDWETGIKAALDPILRGHNINLEGDQLLEEFGGFEAKLEAGQYITYREVLAGVLQNFGQQYGFRPSPEELEQFSNSVGNWPAFPDSASALAILKKYFKLVIISNIDDDLFALSNRLLGVKFDWIITAQQAGSYKPSHHNFDLAFAVTGLPREKFLHVAQSLFHDHVTAKALGLETVWVNRRQGKAGFGATPPVHVTPDLEVPDMATLAGMVQGGSKFKNWAGV